MNKTKNSFFRAFAVTFVILFCGISLAFGLCYARAVCERMRTGNPAVMVEQKSDGIYFYGIKVKPQ